MTTAVRHHAEIAHGTALLPGIILEIDGFQLLARTGRERDFVRRTRVAKSAGKSGAVGNGFVDASEVNQSSRSQGRLREGTRRRSDEQAEKRRYEDAS